MRIIEHILKAQRGSHVTTLGPRYVLYNYMDSLGFSVQRSSESLAAFMALFA